MGTGPGPSRGPTAARAGGGADDMPENKLAASWGRADEDHLHRVWYAMMAIFFLGSLFLRQLLR